MNLKEKFAAKKAAKAKQKAERQAQKSVRVGKMGQTANREHNAIIRRIQTANWADWANQIGTNLFPAEQQAQDAADRQMHYNNLIYEKNVLEALDFFHHQILMMRLFAILEAWQKLADVHFIREIMTDVSNHILIPFEKFTGVTLIDFAKFKRDFVQIETEWK